MYLGAWRICSRLKAKGGINVQRQQPLHKDTKGHLQLLGHALWDNPAICDPRTCDQRCAVYTA